MSIYIILISVLILFIAYKFYGTYIERLWQTDFKRETPANTEQDGVDYVPAPRIVLFGHHFASIAGAAPIIGPIIAISFGWLPVLLWVLIGGIFMGAVHDFGALLISVRHKGENLSQVIEKYMGAVYSKLFILFIWLTSLLVIAAFSSIVADTFVSSPSAATSSVSFILLALLFGYSVNKKGIHIIPATIFGVILLIICIMLGNYFPIALSKSNWILLILCYIIISSITPIWMLLQPRDYLNSFLLYLLIIFAFIGFIFINPEIKIPATIGFIVAGKSLFPYMFLIVACGAISGYHSMFASTTISKQVNNEKDMKPVAFGGMLVESFLAIIAIFVAASFASDKLNELQSSGGPILIFSQGLKEFSSYFGIPENIIFKLVMFSISSFALTSLDSVTRVARCFFQDLIKSTIPDSKPRLKKILYSKFLAAFITVLLGGILSIRGWQIVWPIFGAANQLIASFTFMTLFLWLKHTKKSYKIIILPMIFMFIVTITGLLLMIYSAIQQSQYLLTAIAIALTGLGFAFANSLIKKLKIK
jgi:carbon starvation protein